MAVKRLLQIRPQYDDGNGALASGYRLFFYAAGSSTKQNTYNSSSGSVANTNPIVLSALGEPSVEIWGTVGQTYKIGLAIAGTDDPPASFIWSEDNVAPINDTTVSIDQWVVGPTPTYVSATSFTLVGDQTSTFHKGRRLKTTNTGGTVYSTITGTAFGALTTVTVANDSSTLDSGLSAVNYSLVAADNPSINADMVHRKAAAVVSAATTDIWSGVGDYVHVTGATGPITSFGTAPYAGAERTVIFDSTPTLTHNATSLILPGAANITVAANDRAIVRADTTANMVVVSYVKATGKAVIEAFSAAATQAEQEAAAVITAPVTPGRQQFHPSAGKAWVRFDATSGTPTISSSYNVSSLTDGGVGITTINFATAFSATTYAAVFGGGNGAFATGGGVSLYNGHQFDTFATGSVILRTFSFVGSTNTVTLGDVGTVCAAFFGDQ